MSAPTLSVLPEDDASLRPVPWRRMAWVTWRQHRATLASVALFLGAWAVYLWFGGLQAHRAYATVTGCHPAGSAACQAITVNFNYTYGDRALTAAVIMQMVPALIGAFAGAPILARELETGTFRYAWTQGIGRSRWALAKLVSVAIVLAVAAGVFSQLFSWYFQPFFADGNNTSFAPELFDLRGIALAAWTLAAFAIGALAGMLIRRVVPAIATTLAVYAALAMAVGLFVRQHYATPLVTTKLSLPGSAWIMSQWWTKGGVVVFSGQPSNEVLAQFCPPSVVGPGKPSPGALSGCLAQHGYTQWTSYHPGSRFWQFQWIEGGWLLALSVVLIIATLWLVRRRAA
jgi:ABC-2 family transporter